MNESDRGGVPAKGWAGKLRAWPERTIPSRATIALHAKTAPMARSVTSIDPLAPLAPDTLRAIAATGVARNYPKNTILINEGDVGDSLFIVISGRVKVFSSNAAGREVVIAFHGPRPLKAFAAFNG